jgi:hypothetical protein
VGGVDRALDQVDGEDDGEVEKRPHRRRHAKTLSVHPFDTMRSIHRDAAVHTTRPDGDRNLRHVDLFAESPDHACGSMARESIRPAGQQGGHHVSAPSLDRTGRCEHSAMQLEPQAPLEPVSDHRASHSGAYRLHGREYTALAGRKR